MKVTLLYKHYYYLKTFTKNNVFFGKNKSYNRKSCCQQGFAPLTVTVVHLTFCSFNVAYVLNCGAKTNQIYIFIRPILYYYISNNNYYYIIMLMQHIHVAKLPIHNAVLLFLFVIFSIIS